MSHAELAAIVSACFCALASVSTIALMSHSLGKARKARDRAPIDDPSLDATDAAHPAWWRGTDHAAARWAERTRKAERERDIIKAAHKVDLLRIAAFRERAEKAEKSLGLGRRV